MQQPVEKRRHEERYLTSQSLSRFLLFSMVVLAFFSYLNYSLDLKFLALVQLLVLLTLPPVYSWLKKGAPLGIIKHLIGFDALVIFAPLLFVPTAENTGIYWVFGYPMVTFFFLGTRTGFAWTMAYVLILVTAIGLSKIEVLTLYYTTFQTSLALIEITIFTAIGYFFTSDRERAEGYHLAHLQQLENIDYFERELHSDIDPEKNINNALKSLLSMFNCHRAWLLYPCDPSAPSWNIRHEQTHPDYPGAKTEGVNIPHSNETVRILKKVLSRDYPSCFRHDDSFLQSNTTLKKYSIKSQLVKVIRPDGDQPWLLGLHYCEDDTLCSNEDIRLFQDIASRFEIALNKIVLYRELQTSEQNLRLAIKKAEAASHAKSEFLSVMSHELRTPLHGIIGLQNLISTDAEQLSHEQQENLMLAQQSAKSLRALVNDILDLSKIESGNMELVRGRFELQSCICDALVPFVLSAREKETTISLHLNNVSKTIIGDESRLRQVLLNLVGNAVKFTNQGEVSIHVTQKREKLCFLIKDTGIGISKKNMEHIFEPFVQAADATKPEYAGTGLGTNIVKRFVELMDGKIEASSELGRGSCFTFSIPCHPVGNKTIDHHSSSNDTLFISPPVTSEKKAAVTSPALRVLLAEDDPIGQRIAFKQLSKAGMKVDIVSDGESAWEKVQNCPYDLLLTDIRMPGINGIRLTEKIRAMEKHTNKPHLPIIGLSAHALEDVAKECLEAGMDHFMTKPVDPETILSTVTNQVPQQK